MSSHLLLVLQLVLLDQTLVHVQSLAAGFCKLPAGAKQTELFVTGPLCVAMLINNVSLSGTVWRWRTEDRLGLTRIFLC